MNDNRITNLKSPSHGTDAATKRWVMKQVKDNTRQLELQVQSECNQMKTDIKRLEKGYDATIKEKKVNKIKDSAQRKIDALMERSLSMEEQFRENFCSIETCWWEIKNR